MMYNHAIREVYKLNLEKIKEELKEGEDYRIVYFSYTTGKKANIKKDASVLEVKINGSWYILGSCYFDDEYFLHVESSIDEILLGEYRKYLTRV